MRKRTTGFTLIEVVISLALGGLILSSVLSLFVGFFQTWNAEKTPYEKFIDHIDNCTRFLQNQLNCIVPIVDKNEVKTSRYHCIKINPNNIRISNNWCLGILTSRCLPFLHTNNAGLAWHVLLLSEKGLGFLIESSEIVAKRMAEGVENTGKTKIEFFLLSPYVKNIQYGHHDFEKGNWEFTTSLEDYCKKFPRKNLTQRPDGIQLTFQKEDWEEKRFILLNNAIEETKEKESVNPKEKDKTPGTNDKKTKKKGKYEQG